MASERSQFVNRPLFRFAVQTFAVLLALIAGRSTASGQATAVTDDFVQQRFAALLQDQRLADADRIALQAAFEADLRELAKINEAFNPRLKQAEQGEYGAFATLWAEHRMALTAERERFAAAALALLGEARIDLWRAFDQDERRHRVIPDIATIMPGRPPSLDISVMLDGCSLTGEQRAIIAGMLDDYNQQLDQLLHRYEEQYPALTRARFANPTPEELKRIDDQSVALREECLATPYETIGRIADALGGKARDCLLKQASCAANPQLCGPSPIEEAMRLVRLCEMLTPEQRAASEQIFAEYLPRYLALRMRFEQTQTKWDEPRRKEARAQRRQQFIDQHMQWTDAWANHPGEEMLRSLHQMQRDTLQRLRGLFDETQFAALPPAVRYVLEA